MHRIDLNDRNFLDCSEAKIPRPRKPRLFLLTPLTDGDLRFLGREPTDGYAFIIHQPNGPSGGRLSHIELSDFLREAKGPEQQALLRLIGTLVDVPPFT